MFAEAQDGAPAVELLQQVAHLQCFLEVPVLVHVDRLQVPPARENQRVVLVLRLALAQHGVARELDAVDFLDGEALAAAVGRHRRRVVLDQDRVVAQVALAVHADAVDVRHTEVRMPRQQKLNVVGLVLEVPPHLAVDLARHHVVELELRQHVHFGRFSLLEFRQQPDRGLRVHHPFHGAEQRLRAERRPHARLLQVPRGKNELVVRQAPTLQEVQPILLVQRLQVEDRADAVGVLRFQVVLRQQHVLRVVRRERGVLLRPARGGRRGHVHEQRVHEEVEAAARFRRRGVHLRLPEAEQAVGLAQHGRRPRVARQLVDLQRRVDVVPQEPRLHREHEGDAVHQVLALRGHPRLGLEHVAQPCHEQETK